MSDYEERVNPNGVGRRTDHDILVSIAVLLEELLLEVRRGNSIERTGSVSSVEVKYLANGTAQPVIKAYAGSDAPVVEAFEAYGRAVLLAERAATIGWAQTVELLAAKREAAA